MLCEAAAAAWAVVAVEVGCAALVTEVADALDEVEAAAAAFVAAVWLRVAPPWGARTAESL